MKYRFITIMHNMKLGSTKNKATRVFEGARISNGNKVLYEIYSHAIDTINNNSRRE